MRLIDPKPLTKEMIVEFLKEMSEWKSIPKRFPIIESCSVEDVVYEEDEAIFDEIRKIGEP